MLHCIFEGFYFTIPLDLFFQRFFKWNAAQLLESFYDFSARPFLGENGAAQAFRNHTPSAERESMTGVCTSEDSP